VGTLVAGGHAANAQRKRKLRYFRGAKGDYVLPVKLSIFSGLKSAKKKWLSRNNDSTVNAESLRWPVEIQVIIGK